MNLSEKILGGQSCLLVDSGAAATGRRFYAFVVNEDCVLTTLLTAGNQNLLTTYNLSGKTLKAGTFIPMFKGDPISTITLTSGSVIAYGTENI